MKFDSVITEQPVYRFYYLYEVFLSLFSLRVYGRKCKIHRQLKNSFCFIYIRVDPYRMYSYFCFYLHFQLEDKNVCKTIIKNIKCGVIIIYNHCG